MDIKFQFREKVLEMVTYEQWKTVHLTKIPFTSKKEKIIIQKTPQLWNKLGYSQTPTQKHVFTVNLKRRYPACYLFPVCLTYFMNYKLFT